MLIIPHPSADHWTLQGPAGTLFIPARDEIAHKFAMLYEGDCEGLGPSAAASKFGFSRQRYFQLRKILRDQGTQGLQSQKTGPKGPYRRTDQVQQQVIRHRFLDPEASPAVLAQKLRQAGQAISLRSVQRVIAAFGLQKKTLRAAPQTAKHPTGPDPAHRAGAAVASRRSGKPGTRGSSTPGR